MPTARLMTILAVRPGYMGGSLCNENKFWGEHVQKGVGACTEESQGWGPIQ